MVVISECEADAMFIAADMAVAMPVASFGG